MFQPIYKWLSKRDHCTKINKIGFFVIYVRNVLTHKFQNKDLFSWDNYVLLTHLPAQSHVTIHFECDSE